MGEVLPYLEVNKDNEKEEDIKKEVEVPNITGKTLDEAEKVLKEVNLGIDFNSDKEINKKEVIIQEQLPKAGIKIYEKTKVFVTI